MAYIHGKVLFMITSPRTPTKMIPEIDVLCKNFSGKKWNGNPELQADFMEMLRKEDFFNGEGSKDLAFSARDRINRGPKALGFVDLSPVIKLTQAGEELLNARYTNEIFLRQLLKFQIPSPYHIPHEDAADFWIKPYLEIFRLIRHFGTLTFDELWLFGMQLVDYRKFDLIVDKIEHFRIAKAKARGKQNYLEFRGKYLLSQCREIYEDDIAKGKTHTRENRGESVDKFLLTKGHNMRDYADACQRYLRATGMINISQGRSMSIAPEKIKDVDFFLDNTDREPCFIDNEGVYKAYLFNSSIPKLLTDDKPLLIKRAKEEFNLHVDASYNLRELKELIINKTNERRNDIINAQTIKIKNYEFYDDIQKEFEDLKESYDPSLLLEWNTWRAMTMLDGGNIKANLKFDDAGKPLSTAQGNMADIVCDYGSFGLIVEVTMASGQKQYEMEGEPIMRHLGKFRTSINKPAYCFFIAPNINENCIQYFWTLYKVNLPLYGGTLTILPLPLEVFRKMIQDSFKASYTPQPSQVENLCKLSEELAAKTNSPDDWYKQIIDNALDWLNVEGENYAMAAKRPAPNS